MLGLLAALGFVAHARRSAAAAAAAATLPVFAMTLYFTFSRGAWAALVIGIGSTVMLDPRRFRLLVVTTVVAGPSVLAIAYASQRDTLTTEDTPLTAVAGDGHRVAVVLAAATLFTAALAIVARDVTSRVAISRRARRVFDASLIAVAVLGVVAVVLSVGGPGAAVTKLEDGFKSGPVGEVDLNKRLFSVSGNHRSEQLRVAWDAGRERPFAGNGAGTFEYLWYQRRPQPARRARRALPLHGDVRGGSVGPGSRSSLALFSSCSFPESCPQDAVRRIRHWCTPCLDGGERVRLALGSGGGHINGAARRIRRTPRFRTHDTARASGQASGGACGGAFVLSVLAIWSLRR